MNVQVKSSRSNSEIGSKIPASSKLPPRNYSEKDLLSTGTQNLGTISGIYDFERGLSSAEVGIDYHPLVLEFLSLQKKKTLTDEEKNRYERARKKALNHCFHTKFFKMEIGSSVQFWDNSKLVTKFLRLSKSHKEVEYGEILNTTNARFRSTVITSRISVDNIEKIERGLIMGTKSSSSSAKHNNRKGGTILKDLMNSQFAFTIVVSVSINDADDFADDKRYLWIIAPTPEDFSLWYDGLRGLRSSFGSLPDLTPFTEQEVSWDITIDEEIFNISTELSPFQPAEVLDLEPPSDYEYATSTLASQQMIDASDNLISGQLLAIQTGPSRVVVPPSASSTNPNPKAKQMPNRKWRAPLFLNRN